MSFNVTQQHPGNRLAFVDGTVPVDGQPVRARVAALSAGERDEADGWGVLLFGRDYSATISLDDGMTPEQLVLSLKDNTDGYTDIQSVLRGVPER